MVAATLLFVSRVLHRQNGVTALHRRELSEKARDGENTVAAIRLTLLPGRTFFPCLGKEAGDNLLGFFLDSVQVVFA